MRGEQIYQRFENNPIFFLSERLSDGRVYCEIAKRSTSIELDVAVLGAQQPHELPARTGPMEVIPGSANI